MLAYLRMLHMKLVGNFPQVAAHAPPRLGPFAPLGRPRLRLGTDGGLLCFVKAVVTLRSDLAATLRRFQPRSGFRRRAARPFLAATSARACTGLRRAGRLDWRGDGGGLGMRRRGAGSDALFGFTRKEEVVGVCPPKGRRRRGVTQHHLGQGRAWRGQRRRVVAQPLQYEHKI